MPRSVTLPVTLSVVSPVRSIAVDWKVISGNFSTSKKSTSFIIAVCWVSSIWMLLVCTVTWTALLGTSWSSTRRKPCQSLNEPVVRKTFESPIAKSIEPRAPPMLSLSAAPTADHGSRQTELAPSSRARREGLASIDGLREGFEEALPRRALVLVDRALVLGGGQRHAHRRRHDARLDARLAQHHAVVEIVEVGNAHQRPGVGRGVFVQQQTALAVRRVERRAMDQPALVDGHRAGRAHQRHGLAKIDVATGRIHGAAEAAVGMVIPGRPMVRARDDHQRA